MGFVRRLTGSDAADASRDAAAVQAAAGERAITSQERSLERVRSDLQPFREAGEGTLPGLTSLIEDPEAQKKFVTENPFFKALADDAQDRLFQNQAARGKVGSGGTAKALQNSLLLLGNDLLGTNINQRFNLATLGQNAAAGQATATQATGANISNLTTGIGNVNAAGIVGAANAKAAGAENLLQTGATIASLKLSDERFKTDIQEVGKLNNGLPVYTFRYKNEDMVHMGVMAQEAEKICPEAVHEINGVKYVDYGEITCH